MYTSNEVIKWPPIGLIIGNKCRRLRFGRSPEPQRQPFQQILSNYVLQSFGSAGVGSQMLSLERASERGENKGGK